VLITYNYLSCSCNTVSIYIEIGHEVPPKKTGHVRNTKILSQPKLLAWSVCKSTIHIICTYAMDLIWCGGCKQQRALSEFPRGVAGVIRKTCITCAVSDMSFAYTYSNRYSGPSTC